MYIIVVGAGKVGYYLVKTLLAEGHEVLLVEKDKRTATLAAEDLGEVVLFGDGCEMRTMRHAGMERADVVVAATGDDEDNLVVCQLAKRHFRVPRTIARVNDPKNEDIFQRLGIDQTVASTKIIFNLIEQQIETNQVVPLAALRRGNVEIVEVDLGPDSPVVGRKISELNLPLHSLIIAVIREDHAIIPLADTKLREGDSVIAVVKSEKEPELRGVFGAQMTVS
jgi:trk system potassium uptake protein TrkA